MERTSGRHTKNTRPNGSASTASDDNTSNDVTNQQSLEKEPLQQKRLSTKQVQEAHRTALSDSQEKVLMEAIARLKLRDELDRIPPESQTISLVPDLALDIIFTPMLLSAMAVGISYACHYYQLGVAAALVVAVPILVSSLHVYVQRQVRRGMRDFVAEQRSKRFPDAESVEWINHMLHLVWTNANVRMAQTILETANAKLHNDTKLPPMITELGVQHVDMGTRAPRLEYIQTHGRRDHNNHQLILDVALTWDADMKLRLSAKPTVVPGTPTMNLHLLRVKDVYFHTSLRVVVDLLPNNTTIPLLASAITISMLSKPTIDLNISALGVVGVTEIPGMDGWLRTLIVDSVAKMLCPPNSYRIDLLQAYRADDLLQQQQQDQTGPNPKSRTASHIVSTVLGGAGKGMEMGVTAVGSGVGVLGKGMVAGTGVGVQVMGKGVETVSQGMEMGVTAVGSGVGVLGQGVMAGTGAGVQVMGKGVETVSQVGADAIGSGSKVLGSVGKGVEHVGKRTMDSMPTTTRPNTSQWASPEAIPITDPTSPKVEERSLPASKTLRRRSKAKKWFFR